MALAERALVSQCYATGAIPVGRTFIEAMGNLGCPEHGHLLAELLSGTLALQHATARCVIS
ncbi:MAG: hypothetical protein ACI8Q9_002470 [Planctomycetota bacterium]|jgi:hypothetical protein